MIKSFALVLLLIGSLSLECATPAIGQQKERKPKKPVLPDSLKRSIAFDLMQFPFALTITGEYKIDENVGLQLAAAAGFYLYDSTKRNVTSGYLTNLVLKPGINIKTINSVTGLESWSFTGEAVLGYAYHDLSLRINHSFGTYTGSFRKNLMYSGAGFSIAKVIPASQKFYVDVGPVFYMLTIPKNSLLNETFIPGIGPSWRSNINPMFPTFSAFMKINLRYRF